MKLSRRNFLQRVAVGGSATVAAAGVASPAGSAVAPGFDPRVKPFELDELSDLDGPGPGRDETSGRAWSEPTLLRIAFAFEQTIRARRAPRFLSILPPLNSADSFVPSTHAISVGRLE